MTDIEQEDEDTTINNAWRHQNIMQSSLLHQQRIDTIMESPLEQEEDIQ
jgi:hypothetical protein